MKKAKPKLLLLAETCAVCRLERKVPPPEWGTQGHFFSLTRTDEELSIVCPEDLVPREVKKEGGWRVLKVEGPLDFSLTGVLASLTAPLASEGISVFALSTYDTDYLLVKEGKLEKAIQALREEGFEIKKVRRPVLGVRSKRIKRRIPRRRPA
jgi:hypothetical protein